MAWQDEAGVVEVRLSALTAMECQSALSGPSECIVGEPYSILRISPAALANLVAQANDDLDLHSWLLAQIAMQTAPEPVGKWLAVVFGSLRHWPRASTKTAAKWREARDRRFALAEAIVADERLEPGLPVSARLKRVKPSLKVRGLDGRPRRLNGIGFKTLEADYARPEFKSLLARLRHNDALRAAKGFSRENELALRLLLEFIAETKPEAVDGPLKTAEQNLGTG